MTPEERLLTQLYRRREEAEHRPEDREREEHRETSSHRTHAGPLVERHGGLLLLEHLLLIVAVRELRVDLVKLRLEGRHLGRRSVGLVGQREHHQLDDQRHQKDDEAEAADETAEEVEHRDDRILREPADEPASERDDLLILVAVALENLVVVRAEVELQRHDDVVPLAQFGAHLRTARHQIAVRIVLSEEVDAKLSGGELLRGADDGGEELLLESEPAQTRLHALGCAASASDLHRLVIAVEIVVELGVLGLVLVALFHPGHDKVEIDVE